MTLVQLYFLQEDLYTVSECQNALVVKSAQYTFDSDDHPSENYPRPRSKGQHVVLQITHHTT